VRLFRALGAPASESYAEFVFIGNIAAACVSGAGLWLHGDLTFKHAGIVAVVLFVLFTACLLNRYTVWVSAVFGGLAMSIFPVGVLAGVGLKMDSEVGAWIGGAAGLAFGSGSRS
jgi:ascorbate-specific PTS system EIIC-type component UlaA